MSGGQAQAGAGEGLDTGGDAGIAFATGGTSDQDASGAGDGDGGSQAGAPCTGHTERCGDACVSLATDRANCGGCGVACEAGFVCAGSGACALSCQTALTDCAGSCVDIHDDPNNCGGCNAVCASDRICVAGTCEERVPCAVHSEVCNGLDDNCDGQMDEPFKGAPFHLGERCSVGIGACQSIGTTVCASGGLSTTCSATPHPPQTEQCNQIDDDCDGLVDYEIDAGRPQSVCSCADPPLVLTSAEPCSAASGCSVPQCGLSDAGLTMGYELRACTTPFPFAQCIYQGVSLNRFDADHSGTGLLKISLHVTATHSGQTLNALNFYYGRFPFRKKIAFFSDAELNQGVTSNTYRRSFQPSDATCVLDAGIPNTCATGCQNGVWGSPNRPECVFDYDNVPLWLTAEGCRGPAGAVVDQIQIRYLTGRACTCLKDADCGDTSRPVCDMRHPVLDPRCAANQRCAGVCVPQQ